MTVSGCTLRAAELPKSGGRSNLFVHKAGVCSSGMLDVGRWGRVVTVQLSLGLDVIRSYKRLAYTPWHALAEFVDNSTQSYFNNEDALGDALAREGEGLSVDVVYDRQSGKLRVTDNSIGMALSELERALCVGLPPDNDTGRSQYGMGLKTAACWYGDTWTVRTKKLGETSEYTVTVDVEAVAAGNQDLPTVVRTDRDSEDHYTVIEVSSLHRKMQGRTLGKIRQFLSSMYRQDIREGILTLRWQGEVLAWDDSDARFAQGIDGTRYKMDFDFEVDGKSVYGWVGVLDRGSRSLAGFSILRAGRVIRGWPDSWRPESLYGQIQGSNDLVNQRLQGEIHLDDFPVSHTKDDILWFGDQEQDVEDHLAEVCREYREVARTRRQNHEDERGPSAIEIQAAVEELQAELSSAEMIDAIEIAVVPPREVVDAAIRPLVDAAGRSTPSFCARVGEIEVAGYLVNDASPNDPYVAVESTRNARILVVVNMQHPHCNQLEGAQGVLNYLRHCVYDGIAEWQARHMAGRLDPETVKILKDRLLRLAVNIEFAQPVAAS